MPKISQNRCYAFGFLTPNIMISKKLETIEDFENLKKGDLVACEFHRDIHDYPKQYRFKVFPIVKVRTDTKEVILQTKNNIYFNYKMFVDGESNLLCATLLQADA